MKQYVYRFLDGTANNIELPDNWADILMELDHKEELNNRRETRRHQSLDKLLEFDDFLIVSNEPGPLEILIAKDIDSFITPMLSLLTIKQKRIMYLYHVCRYKKVEIAKMLKIDESSVRGGLSRATKRILKFLNI